HDVEVALVETRAFPVEAFEARRHAGDAFAALGSSDEDVERAMNRFSDGTDGGVLGDPSDVEDGLLGLVDEFLRLTGAAVAFGGEALARRDEPPDAPLLAHDASVRADVRYRGNRIRQLSEIWGTAHLLQAFAVAEPRSHGNHVDRPPVAL